MCCRKKAKDTQTQKLQQQAGSLKQLKQQLHEIAAAKVTQKACSHGDGDDANAREGAAVPPEGEVEAYIPMEQNQVLTQEDFARIRKLKVRFRISPSMVLQSLLTASMYDTVSLCDACSLHGCMQVTGSSTCVARKQQHRTCQRLWAASCWIFLLVFPED